MKASELIKELQKQIDTVGDRELYIWNEYINDFDYVSKTYFIEGINTGIVIDGYFE